MSPANSNPDGASAAPNWSDRPSEIASGTAPEDADGDAAYVGQPDQVASPREPAAPATLAPEELVSARPVGLDVPAVGLSDIVLDGGETFDLSGWDAEVVGTPPSNDATVPLAALAVHAAITQHIPIDTSADWDDFDAFLPDLAAPMLSADDTEVQVRLRRLFLRALREGSVPHLDIEDICQGRQFERDTVAEALLCLVINDIGAETDERVEYGGIGETYGIDVDPLESPEDEEAVDAALASLDDLRSHRDEPLLLFMREARRERRISAHEEVDLAKAMETAIARSLDALAVWPAGIAKVLAAAELVRLGGKPVSFLSKAVREDSIVTEASPDNDAPPTSVAIDVAADPVSETAIATTQQYDVSQDAERSQFLDSLSALEAMVREHPNEDSRSPALRDALVALSIKRSFLLELANLPPHDRPRSAVLFQAAIDEYRSARDRFALANLRLVYSIARRYVGSGLPMDDLLQEGHIGLLDAAEKFDWRRGYKFSTMATWWIRQRITRAVADNCRTIRLPAHVHDVVKSIHRETQAFERAHGRSPSIEELALHLSVMPSKIQALLAADTPPSPLDDLDPDDIVDDSEDSDPFSTFVASELRCVIDLLLAGLAPKQAKILRLRFGLDLNDPLTLEEVAAQFTVTRERIRQIEAKALGILMRPNRAVLLRGWLRDALPGQADPAREDDIGDSAGDAEESTAARSIECIETAESPTQHAASGTERAVADLSDDSPALSELLLRAKAIGCVVDDQRDGQSGLIMVKLAGEPDSLAHSLILELLRLGFKKREALGYAR